MEAYTVDLFTVFQLLTWTSEEKSVDTTEKTVFKEIDLVTVFDAILTIRQTCEKLQCLYENLMSNNSLKTAVLKKISIVN